ncbi:unnamed protein product [Amaranthus hypochondriacus]
MATTTSTSCSFWNNFRPGGPTKVRGPSSGCGKTDGLAMWLINGVTTAFFASLEKCSCVRVTTVEDPEDVNELPLIFNDGNTRDDEAKVSSNIRRRHVRGKK